MRGKLVYHLLTILTIFNISCRTGTKDAAIKSSDSTSVIKNSLKGDTFELKESFDQEDNPANEYLIEQLKPIRENFKRINSITNWTSIDTLELWETTEGGEAEYYCGNGRLEKIIVRHFGETFQVLTEYYLLNKQLSFVFEKSYGYNRPLFYDSTSMKENNDTEAFDFDKSEITEDRNYFENGKLLHKLSSGDCGAPFAKEYLLEEQKRIIADFDKLIANGPKQ